MAVADCRTARPGSRLVTSVAWLSIVLCALCALTTGADTLLLAVMAGNEPLREALQEPSAAGLMTPQLIAMIQSGAAVPWFAAGTAASVIGLLASVALLRRREWGRRLFVWLLLAAIPLTWAGAIAAHVLKQAVLVVAVSYLIAVVVTGVHLWLARELGRETVRAEFGGAAAGARSSRGETGSVSRGPGTASDSKGVL